MGALNAENKEKGLWHWKAIEIEAADEHEAKKDSKMKIELKTLMRTTAILGIMAMFASQAFAQDQAKPQDQVQQQEQSETAKSAQPEVDSDVAIKAAEQRQKILDGAVTALDETKKALTLLSDNKTEEALAALEVATGKLELILAREPKLALAPVDTAVVIHDLYAETETIKTAIRTARDLLDDGEVQEARPLVANLASEVVFQTNNLPLATYPAAIKSAVRQIDDGKIEEAKITLETALSTLVVTEVAVPLPALRAQILLEDADKLAEKSDRSEEENKQLVGHLAEVRKQIQLAEVLGYGEKADFEPIYDQIDQIEEKSGGGKSGTGWFDKIKKQVSDLF